MSIETPDKAMTYGYSNNGGETWSFAGFPTREAAFMAALGERDDHESYPLFIYTAEQHYVHPADFIDAERLLDDLEERMGEETGADDQLLHADDDDHEELQWRLEQALRRWVKDKPTRLRRYYEATNIVQHPVDRTSDLPMRADQGTTNILLYIDSTGSTR